MRVVLVVPFEEKSIQMLPVELDRYHIHELHDAKSLLEKASCELAQ